MAWQGHVYGEANPAAQTACAKLSLPLNIFPWSAQAERAGLARSAFYLVRPDGYVALADRDGDAKGLEQFCKKRGVSFGLPVAIRAL